MSVQVVFYWKHFWRFWNERMEYWTFFCMADANQNDLRRSCQHHLLLPWET